MCSCCVEFAGHVKQQRTAEVQACMPLHKSYSSLRYCRMYLLLLLLCVLSWSCSCMCSLCCPLCTVQMHRSPCCMGLSQPSAGCSRTSQRHSSAQQQRAPAALAAAAYALLLATATSRCCCMGPRGVARRSWCMRWHATWAPTCCTSLQVGAADAACMVYGQV
jgi:hypothetical protein